MMKKTVLFVAAAVFATATFAQDGLTSKKGEAYLPEAGDWAIGFDGTPFLNYAGNMFNGNTGNSVNASWVGNTPQMTIVGKMFKDESTAYRAKVRIGFGSSTQEGITDTSNTTLTGEITDEMKTSNTMITLGFGLEKRKGNTRIQGFYGAEALISFGANATEYTYADQSTATHNASQFDFGSNVYTSNVLTAIVDGAGAPVLDQFGNPTFANVATPNGERVTKNSAGSTFQLGIRGFIGVEWFIAPKVSVSAEYGWGLMMSSTGAGEIDTEEFTTPTGGASQSVVARKHTTGGSSAFGIDTDNNGGQITIMFHF